MGEKKNNPLNSPSPTSTPRNDADHRWHERVETEAMRVGDFVTRGLKGLHAQLAELTKIVEELQPEEDQKVEGTESHKRVSISEIVDTQEVEGHASDDDK